MLNPLGVLGSFFIKTLEWGGGGGKQFDLYAGIPRGHCVMMTPMGT